MPGLIIWLRAGHEQCEVRAAGERVALVPENPPDTDPEGAEGAAASYQTVMLPDVGLRFEVPVSWLQLESESAWMPESGSDVQVGASAVHLEPPMQPEAVLLPEHAQIVDSEAVDLGWAAGRRFELDVYGPAAEGAAPTPVESVQVHVLVVVRQGQERIGLDFYASAPDADAMEGVRPVLDHLLDSAALTEPMETVLPDAGEAQTEGWQVLQDETFGFQVRMPPDWSTKEMATEGPGVPEDWPLERSVILYPATWAERFEETGAPPDPEDPPAVPAMQLDVYVGSREQLRRALPEPAMAETLEISDTQAVRETDIVSDAVTLARFIFQVPDDQDVWIVPTDNYSNFAERRRSAPELSDLVLLVVRALEFSS